MKTIITIMLATTLLSCTGVQTEAFLRNTKVQSFAVGDFLSKLTRTNWDNEIDFGAKKYNILDYNNIYISIVDNKNSTKQYYTHYTIYHLCKDFVPTVKSKTDKNINCYSAKLPDDEILKNNPRQKIVTNNGIYLKFSKFKRYYGLYGFVDIYEVEVIDTITNKTIETFKTPGFKDTDFADYLRAYIDQISFALAK